MENLRCVEEWLRNRGQRHEADELAATIDSLKGRIPRTMDDQQTDDTFLTQLFMLTDASKILGVTRKTLDARIERIVQEGGIMDTIPIPGHRNAKGLTGEQLVQIATAYDRYNYPNPLVEKYGRREVRTSKE